MIIAITVIIVLLVSAIFGGVIYLLFGSIVAALIAAVAIIICVCVTFGVVRIISFFDKKNQEKYDAVVSDMFSQSTKTNSKWSKGYYGTTFKNE
jgi:multidrug efflux pump subunit AcrB